MSASDGSRVLGWAGGEALPEGTIALLEASAGTGKTWQIEALVVRLVAQYQVPIDRIVVITFTTAATAELRDRIRRRLTAARDALAEDAAPAGDPILAELWASASERAARRQRLAAALSSFDLAPISTIHGFSQRMLELFAFESGQEPALEVIADARAIHRNLADDELARTFAAANAEEIAVLNDMGWSRATLRVVAEQMSGAVAPQVEPALDDVDADAHDPLAPVRAWLRAKEALRRWLAEPGDEAAAYIAALDAETALPNKATKTARARRLDGRRLPTSWRTKQLQPVLDWLAGAALPSTRPSTQLTRMTLDGLRSAWTGDPAELESFAARPLFARIGALVAEQDRLWPRALVAFAVRARARVEHELQRRGALTYDAMLSRLAERIAGEGGDALTAAIRGRYAGALVDEFQDTDGAQWPVMRAAFGAEDQRLLLIGDPKQSIYAFRGADVHVYLEAAARARLRATMRTNWRSDASYVLAMNHLWAAGSGAFELPEIDYVEVEAAAQAGARIRGLPDEGGRPRRAFELRWVDGTTIGSDEETTTKPAGEQICARLAALEIARMLTAEVELLPKADASGEASWRGLRPGDIAVLSRTNRQGELVRRELARLGVPAVSAGRGRVTDSPVLGWLCAWLDAVANPGGDRPARALAVTPLFGWTARELARALADADAPVAPTPLADPASRAAADSRTAADSPAGADAPAVDAERRDWNAWMNAIHTWARRWSSQGFVRVLERALDDHGAVTRLLGARNGERYATDLRHLVELCHAEERRTRTGPAGLASWLRSTAADDAGATGEGDAEARELRLESDALAVQLVTVHSSKGIEYPVVLLPFAWEERTARFGDAGILWHRSLDGRARLCLDLHAKDSPARKVAQAQAELENRREQQRLLYVALTRARHHCVAWLGPLGKRAAIPDHYALGRLALRERDDAGRPTTSPAAEALAGASVAQDRLTRLADSSGGTIGWSAARDESRRRVTLPNDAAPELRAKPWKPDRKLSSAWMVASFSSIVGGRTYDADEPQRPDEARRERAEADESELDEGVEAGGEPEDRVDVAEPVDAIAELDLPIASRELRGGKEVGTWVHAVFERLDLQRGHARDGKTLAELISELGARYGITEARQHALVGELVPKVLDTPLDGGPTGLPSGFSLRRLQAADHLDELEFDLRLGAGSRWRPPADGSGVDHALIDDARVRLALATRDSAWDGHRWLADFLRRGSTTAQDEDTDPKPADTATVLPRIAGLLTGVIDLVFRAETDGGGGRPRMRYFVCDYKTNLIASRDHRRDSRLVHYTRRWLAREMAHHHYHLQSLLYTLALHRLLRQRLADYDYERDVGGHLYLFLRGMGGIDTPRHENLALGVYSDRWPASVVLGLDAALEGTPADARRPGGHT